MSEVHVIAYKFVAEVSFTSEADMIRKELGDLDFVLIGKQGLEVRAAVLRLHDAMSMGFRKPNLS